MNTTQTAKGDLLATIQVNLVKADYEADVNNALKEYQHKATLPGFRPGKVPFGMIKKMYGQAVFMEKLNKKVSEALNNYIIENKLDIIGYPLPDPDKEQPVDPENQEELDFFFEIALKPVIDVQLKNYKIDAYNLKASKEEIDRTIESILNNNKEDDKPAELNEELFDKVFPGKDVKDVETFRSLVAVEMEKQYVAESDRMFFNKAIDELVENMKFDIPDSFLKRWIVENSNGKITAEDIEKNYDNTYSKSLRWQLIEEAIVKQNPDLIIKDEEVRNFVINSYFPNIKLEEIDDNMKQSLNGIVDSLLKDEQQQQNINNQLADNKLTAFLKANMDVTVKESNYEDFVKAVMPAMENTPVAEDTDAEAVEEKTITE